QGVLGFQREVVRRMDECLGFALDQQDVDAFGHALQHLVQRHAFQALADVYFHDEFAVAHGNVVVDHGVAERLGHAYAHLFLGMDDAVHAQLAQDEMLGMRGGFDPDRLYAQGLQMDDAQQAGLDGFAYGDQNHVVVVQSQFFEGGAVGDVGDDRVRQLIGVLVDDFTVGVDPQDR